MENREQRFDAKFRLFLNPDAPSEDNEQIPPLEYSSKINSPALYVRMGNPAQNRCSILVLTPAKRMFCLSSSGIDDRAGNIRIVLRGAEGFGLDRAGARLDDGFFFMDRSFLQRIIPKSRWRVKEEEGVRTSSQPEIR
jgi:hypothetical protein